MTTPKELEQTEAAEMIREGEIRPTETGEENTYFEDADGVRYFCKGYRAPGALPAPKTVT